MSRRRVPPREKQATHYVAGSRAVWYSATLLFFVPSWGIALSLWPTTCFRVLGPEQSLEINGISKPVIFCALRQDRPCARVHGLCDTFAVAAPHDSAEVLQYICNNWVIRSVRAFRLRQRPLEVGFRQITTTAYGR